ncbi:MAG: hypothetical protein R3337_06295 [Gammaproteobacteria bacterium]|nr:hypothetical protein [Gammaproteobacteria bacterium]
MSLVLGAGALENLFVRTADLADKMPEIFPQVCVTEGILRDLITRRGLIVVVLFGLVAHGLK